MWHVQRHVPLKTKVVRTNHTTYMNRTLTKAIMKRSELEIKYLKNRTIENRIRYEKWRNFYSKLYKKKGKICIQIQNWEIWLARGFDFVLPLGVITPVMNTGEVDFDMLKSMEFGNLVDLLQSLRGPFI